MHASQLTRFLDPAAESRVRLTRALRLLGLDPEAFPSVPRMSRTEAEQWALALERARDPGPVHLAASGLVGTDPAYDAGLELEAC